MDRLLPLLHPVPIVLVGVRVSSDPLKANFTTVGDVAIAGLNPPLIMLSLHARHLSTERVDQEGQFSLHVPEADMVTKVDYCGMVSGRDVDKSALFDFEWHESLPVIKGMPITLYCKVVHRAQIEQRVIYVARIFGQSLREGLSTSQLGELQTITYGLDNNYYGVGPVIGRGYHEGKKLR